MLSQILIFCNNINTLSGKNVAHNKPVTEITEDNNGNRIDTSQEKRYL